MIPNRFSPRPRLDDSDDYYDHPVMELGTTYEVSDEPVENPFREFPIGFHLPPSLLFEGNTSDAIQEAVDEACS